MLLRTVGLVAVQRNASYLSIFFCGPLPSLETVGQITFPDLPTSWSLLGP